MNSNNKEDAYANMENYKHYLTVKLKGGGGSHGLTTKGG